MSENKNKSWPNFGFMKNGDTGPFISKNPKLNILVDGEVVNCKSVSMPRFLTIYDKDNGKEIVIGKLVKTKNKGTWIQYNENISFALENNDGKEMVESSGIGNLKSKEQRAKELDALEADGKLNGDALAKAREQVSWSEFVVSLPPPRD